MRKSLLVFVFLLTASLADAQENFANAYKVLNNDATLRLDYIEHKDNETIAYITYLGKTTSGQSTGLLLNDYKLVVHSTGEIFRPVASIVPSQSDSKFFLWNTGVGIQLIIRFPRIPRYVKEFDLVEPTTSETPSYNFTFRNLKVDPSNNVQWQIDGWAMDAKLPKFIQVFTNTNMNLEVYINDIFVGSLSKFFKPNIRPECGQYGTLRIAFADGEKKKVKVVGRYGSKIYTWEQELTPLMYCYDYSVNL